MAGELTGILLAAGQGARFGGDKGLAQLPDGTPMTLRSALNLRYALPDVVCVVRPGDTMLHNLLCEHDFNVVVAADAAQGMSASLQAGIRAAPVAAGWIVALADMPLIQADTYQQLIVAFSAKQQLTVPYFAATPGHPVIFPARYKSELLALRGDKGAKSILQQHTDVVQRVSVDDPGILQDFDTPTAFKRLFM